MRATATTMALSALLALTLAAHAAEPPAKMEVFYFGNSFTGCSAPEMHPKLGASAGKTWQNRIIAGPGWPIWYFLAKLRQESKRVMSLIDGKWTINPEFKPTDFKPTEALAASFHSKKWDAIMFQPFGAKLKYEPVTAMWDLKFDEPTDTGNIRAAIDLIKIYLDANNKDGSVFVFQSWVGNPLVAVAGSPAPNKELNHQQMEPIRRSFDFGRAWMQSYVSDPSVMQWEGAGTHTRDCQYQLMDALIAAYPDLWKSGRLRLMPVPDVWSLLDRRARAGMIAGLANVGEFHTDGGHTRSGLSAYIAAATFYTVTFRSRPHDLDYTIANEWSNHTSDPLFSKDPNNDFGVLFKITPELAKAVNDAIWDVVQAHPHTGFGGSREKLEALEAATPAPEPVRVLEISGTPLLAPRIHCFMPAWQADVDRRAGKQSAWMAYYHSWYPLSRYASELRDKGTPKQLLAELTDKNWKTCRLDKLALSPVNSSDAEADAAVWLASRFLDTHPKGEVLLFIPWPELKAASELRKSLKLEAWQPLTVEQLAPVWKAFNYAAARDAAATEKITARVKAGVGAEKAGRVRVVDIGALLAALDAKLRAGALAGVASVSEFYKDGDLLRTGLPRYALTALRHAVVHNSHPKALSTELFDQPKVYPPDAMDPKTPHGWFKVAVADEEFDNGPHFAITPAGKKLVDDVVWELVGNKQQ